MRTLARALCVLCLALAPLPLAAQEGDAFVLPPGMVRLRAAVELSRFDALSADGGSRPLGSELAGPLTARSFAPLRPLETELGGFLAGAGSPVAVDAQTFQLGALDAAATASTRVAPLSVAAGVLPRLEVGLTLPLVYDEIQFTRLGVAGGTLGGNPDPEGNAEVFALFGEQWSALGSSPVLPVDSSALGRELLRLVAASFPGETLALPDSAADLAILNQLLGTELGLAPLESRASEWRVGDVELSARFALLSTLGGSPVPTDSGGLHYRAAVSVSARLPTGSEPDSVRPLSLLPDVGQSGFGVGLDGDLFLGERIWATASLHYARRSEVEVLRRVADPDAPLSSPERPQAIRWSPADLLALRLAPRLRLTDAISLGAQYSLARRGSTSFEIPGGPPDAGILSTAGGVSQSAGLGLRYSTLPAYWGGAGLLPVEVVLRYERTLSAPAGQPEASRVLLQADVFHRVMGNR